jgi:hypothetical protein
MADFYVRAATVLDHFSAKQGSLKSYACECSIFARLQAAGWLRNMRNATTASACWPFAPRP